ncbi:hypothetical protein DEJ25_09555 [Curtobacterium sp. MCPF17_011]|uniref:hypothetical protein n=1 Tax=unclassified Curtobacterium TaxID=257496 RepID=UPI000D9DCCF3|nr:MULTISPECIES: hypothetical protein [unclassified Curtobacterium]PYY31951.1 hypothetical protein DEI89_14920 [Curtobacterium sp. MCBD17_030]PZF12065.1 hypothetical protein DEJ25_09555 [Curtobacterium sp. MCPF17_011]
MDASKYLPPFTQGQRGDTDADQRDDQDGTSASGPAGWTGERQMVDAGGTEHEATYADFLGDQVDD